MLKDIKRRIHSVLSIIKMTNAMKLVAASKLKKIQTDIYNMQHYAKKIDSIYNSFANEYNDIVNNKSKKKLLIIISSNRGLCGSFNSLIIKETLKSINKNIVLLTIGTKCKDVLLHNKYTIYKDLSDLLSNINFKNVSMIVDNLLKEFMHGNFNFIQLIYNKIIKNKPKIIKKQFLPILPPPMETKNSYSIFEPSKKEIIEYIIPLKLKMIFLKALLESSASENVSRMIAMHKAIENAKDLKSKLELAYNKARQANITKEILEIVNGLY
ncbi:MAG: ATP synthase F1 subunit gamma [Candidatus Bostrichicola ureolyticus]|nr:MAG: ATP synthase F1 subunit gamma [Candidatus Bostrichicola ureolyticus]